MLESRPLLVIHVPCKVACLACFKCHTSLEHLDDEFGVVEQQPDTNSFV